MSAKRQKKIVIPILVNGFEYARLPKELRADQYFTDNKDLTYNLNTTLKKIFSTKNDQEKFDELLISYTKSTEYPIRLIDNLSELKKDKKFEEIGAHNKIENTLTDLRSKIDIFTDKKKYLAKEAVFNYIGLDDITDYNIAKTKIDIILKENFDKILNSQRSNGEKLKELENYYYYGADFYDYAIEKINNLKDIISAGKTKKFIRNIRYLIAILPFVILLSTAGYSMVNSSKLTDFYATWSMVMFGSVIGEYILIATISLEILLLLIAFFSKKAAKTLIKIIIIVAILPVTMLVMATIYYIKLSNNEISIYYSNDYYFLLEETTGGYEAKTLFTYNDIDTFEIPENDDRIKITTISENFFNSAPNIETLNLGHVTNFDKPLLTRLTKLKSLTMSLDGCDENTTLEKLFGYNDNVIKEYIPSTLTDITILNSDGDEGTKIPDKFFANAKALENLTMPSDLCFVGNDILKNCNNIKYSSSQENPNIKYLETKDNVKVYLASAKTNQDTFVINDDVKVIGQEAFAQCNIKNIVISENVLSVGNNIISSPFT